MVEAGDQLMMLWSGRGPKGYAMGSAYSEGGILGPWKQNEQLAFEEDGGHGMVFRKFTGELMMTVHQPNQTPNERPKFFEAKIQNKAIVLASAKEEPEQKPEEQAKPLKRQQGVHVKDEMPYWLL